MTTCALSEMKNGIIRNDYMIQKQRVTDTSYSGFCWPKRRMGNTSWHITRRQKRNVKGGHFMTYYTSSKYYGRTHMHDNIVPWALRALGTKIMSLTSYLGFQKAPTFRGELFFPYWNVWSENSDYPPSLNDLAVQQNPIVSNRLPIAGLIPPCKVCTTSCLMVRDISYYSSWTWSPY